MKCLYCYKVLPVIGVLTVIVKVNPDLTVNKLLYLSLTTDDYDS